MRSSNRVQDTDPGLLAQQLQTALDAMQMLARFEPRLTGPLAELVADVRLPIVLHVQADHGDDVRMHLDEQQIPARSLETRLHIPRGASQTLPGLGFIAGDQEILVWVFTPAQFRQRLRVGRESAPSQRLNLQALRKQLEDLQQQA
jgi:hypothetical protein